MSGHIWRGKIGTLHLIQLTPVSPLLDCFIYFIYFIYSIKFHQNKITTRDGNEICSGQLVNGRVTCDPIYALFNLRFLFLFLTSLVFFFILRDEIDTDEYLNVTRSFNASDRLLAFMMHLFFLWWSHIL